MKKTLQMELCLFFGDGLKLMGGLLFLVVSRLFEMTLLLLFAAGDWIQVLLPWLHVLLVTAIHIRFQFVFECFPDFLVEV